MLANTNWVLILCIVACFQGEYLCFILEIEMFPKKTGERGVSFEPPHTHTQTHPVIFPKVCFSEKG